MTILAEDIKNRLLAGLRSSGNLTEDFLSELNELHFPGKRQEEWKYSVPPFSSDSFSLPSEIFRTEVSLPENLPAGAICMVFIGGKFSAEHSSTLPEGLKIVPAKDFDVSPYEVNLFGKLNQATEKSCAIHLNIEKNARIEKPVFLIQYQSESADANWIQPCISIRAGENSAASFVETGAGNGWQTSVLNIVNDICLDRGASLSWLNLQDAAPGSITVNQTRATLAADARLRHLVLAAGKAYSRNNLDIHIEGKGAHADLFGLSLGTGKSHSDHHSFVHHAVENSSSNQLYKGVYAGKSTGVFNGKILVDQAAQKTNAYQSGRNILLSPDARVYAKPQLEIFADDVKCSHGATIGQLEEEPLFYLRSRGLDLAAARLLLIRAFASEILMEISSESLRSFAEELMLSRLDEMTKSL